MFPPLFAPVPVLPVPVLPVPLPVPLFAPGFAARTPEEAAAATVWVTVTVLAEAAYGRQRDDGDQRGNSGDKVGHLHMCRR